MIDCPMCRSLLLIGLTPECPLCKKERVVTEEVFVRWKYRSAPHNTFTFHGEGEESGTQVTVAITEAFPDE